MARIEDLRFNSGEYIPQYAGIPLQQIQQTADTLANRHYSNLAQASQLQILQNQLKSQALPGAKAYFDQHIQGVQSALEDMAKNGGENATARINAMATAFQSDQGMLNAMQRRKEYDKQTELIDKLLANNEQPLYDKARREALANASPTDEIYNTPYASEAEGYIDPFDEREKIWDVIKPDSYEGEIRAALKTAPAELIGQAFDGENPDLPMFFEAVTRGGISGQKIKNMLDEAWTSYKNTKSYKQQKGKLIGKDDNRIKQEFYEQGLLRVFNNVSREYRPTPNFGRLQRGSEEAIGGVRTPLPASFRKAIDPGFDPSMINPETGAVEPSFMKKLVSGTGIVSPEGLRLNAMQRMKEAEVQKDPEVKKMLIANAEDMMKEADRAEKSIPELTKEETANMIKTMRTALEVAGVTPYNMDDATIQKLARKPEYQAIMNNYLTNIAGKRYHQPFINNITDEKTRQANEDFARGNFSQREIIDMSTGKYYNTLKDEDGEVHEDLLNFSKALVDKKAIVEGTIDPKHAITEVENASQNFVRALRVQVPDDKGNMKEYLVGQLPTTTSQVDINENILYRKATISPGGWNEVNSDMSIIEPEQGPQKEKYWNEIASNTGITKEQYDNSKIVIIKSKSDGDLVFPNYTKAAQYLAEKGVKLKFK